MSTNRHGTGEGSSVGSPVGLLFGRGVGPTVATSDHTSFKLNFYSNQTVYYLASLTCMVGDSRVHHLLPNQQALYSELLKISV